MSEARKCSSAALSEVTAHEGQEQSATRVLSLDLSRPTYTGGHLTAPMQEPTGDSAPSPGQNLAGRYTVLEVLGQGGMGVVVAAYDARLDRRVALKLLRSEAPGEADGLQTRLVREAQAMARLSHPHVVAVYDAGPLEDGRVFIAMEYVEGQTLNAWCREGARSWRETLTAYVAAGRGLAAAHEVGLVHRDFKPENVLVGRDGRVRVTDFGVARAESSPSTLPTQEVVPELLAAVAAQPGAWDTPLTLPGMVVGTPKYLAPELLAGRSADARSDLFAFCVALYEALYKQPAFSGATVSERSQAQLQGRSSPLPAQTPVPAWVGRTVLRGLQADPQLRQESMLELLAALEDDPQVRWRARLRMAGMVAVTVVLTGVALAGWLRHQAQAPACGHQAQRLVGVWDKAVKGQLRQALVGTGLPYATGTAERVEAALDSYAATWVRLRTEVCETSRGQADHPERLTLLQESCLERRRTQLRTLVELLARGPDTALVSKAVEAAQSLPPLEHCTDAQALTAAVPLPEQPEARARAEALREQVDRLEMLWQAGKYQEGVTLGESLLPEVEALAHAPLWGSALYHLSRLHLSAGNATQAEAHLRQALVQAARGKDDVLVARAWYLLVWIMEVFQARRPEVLDLERTMLELTVERAGDSLARAESFNALAAVLYTQGRYAEARDWFERAQRLMSSTLGPEHPFVPELLNNTGLALAELGRFDEARARYEQALLLGQRALGPEHPRVLNVLINLGRALVRLGILDEAEAILERARASYEKGPGPSSPEFAEVLLGLGELRSARGQPSQATAILERALPLAPLHDRAGVQFALASALWDSGGGRARALSLATEALQHYQRIGNQLRSEEVSRWLTARFSPARGLGARRR